MYIVARYPAHAVAIIYSPKVTNRWNARRKTQRVPELCDNVCLKSRLNQMYSHFIVSCFGCFQPVFIRACGFSNCWCNLDLMGSFCLMSSQSTQVHFFRLNSVTLLCRKMMIEAPRYFLSMIFLRMTGLFVFLHRQH